MRVHLLDGTYELFRAHFSKRPEHTAPDGRALKATVGVVSSIFALLADATEGITHIAAAFDNPIRSFRNDLFAGYKTDAGIDPSLLAQFESVEQALRAMGIVVWSMDRFEADDALATASARFAETADQVRVLTPDKDLGQCVRGERVVQVDRVRARVIDEAELFATRGIRPCSVPDYLALVGDTADGIPGLAGFGEKTASALLRTYLHLEQIPRDSAAWTVPLRGADRLAATLAKHFDEAILYRKLATLVVNVPLTESIDDLEWKGLPRETWGAWCDAVGASEAFRTRSARWTRAES